MRFTGASKGIGEKSFLSTLDRPGHVVELRHAATDTRDFKNSPQYFLAFRLYMYSYRVNISLLTVLRLIAENRYKMTILRRTTNETSGIKMKSLCFEALSKKCDSKTAS